MSYLGTSDAEPITMHAQYVEDRSLVYLVGTWPGVTAISAAFLRTADHDYVRLAYPFVMIRFENARAVYRVDTCDRGTWRATLVEGHISEPFTSRR